MTTCDTCKHWKECDWMSGEDEVRGLCNHPMVYRPTYGPERNNQNHTDTWKPDRVYTCDEGGGTGELCTGPKFGRLHWEKRPDSEAQDSPTARISDAPEDNR